MRVSHRLWNCEGETRDLATGSHLRRKCSSLKWFRGGPWFWFGHRRCKISRIPKDFFWSQEAELEILGLIKGWGPLLFVVWKKCTTVTQNLALPFFPSQHAIFFDAMILTLSDIWFISSCRYRHSRCYEIVLWAMSLLRTASFACRNPSVNGEQNFQEYDILVAIKFK